jgi:hypothetical protein
VVLGPFRYVGRSAALRPVRMVRGFAKAPLSLYLDCGFWLVFFSYSFDCVVHVDSYSKAYNLLRFSIIAYFLSGQFSSCSSASFLKLNFLPQKLHSNCSRRSSMVIYLLVPLCLRAINATIVQTLHRALVAFRHGVENGSEPVSTKLCCTILA